jgi:hypothetical protein
VHNREELPENRETLGRQLSGDGIQRLPKAIFSRIFLYGFLSLLLADFLFIGETNELLVVVINDR